MKLRELKKLFQTRSGIMAQIFSNSYSGYCIRIKDGDTYHTLDGWFGKTLKFDNVEQAADYLRHHTNLQYAYLIQSLAQDEVDPKKENDHDLHSEEEQGTKINLRNAT